ncbi:MAG: hypothetical protein F7B61_02395 [Caldisphaeraceae archaeon]|nr:hypothetical protein [Caldisphaeraceae archaeon]
MRFHEHNSSNLSLHPHYLYPLSGLEVMMRSLTRMLKALTISALNVLPVFVHLEINWLLRKYNLTNLYKTKMNNKNLWFLAEKTYNDEANNLSLFDLSLEGPKLLIPLFIELYHFL